MARIQTYTRSNPLSAGPVAGEAPITAFQGGTALNDGKALQSGLNDVAETLDRIQQRNEQVWVNNTVTQARYNWQKGMEERMNGAEPGAPGFTQNVAKDWNSFVNEQMKNAPTGRAGQVLQSHLNDLGMQIQNQSMHFEAEQRVAKVANDMMTAIDTNGAILLRDPSQFDKLYAEQESYVAGLKGQLKPSQQMELHKGLQEMAVTALEGMALKDPKIALEQINSGKFDGKINALRLAGLMEQIKAKSEVADIQTIYTEGEKFKSALTTLEDTGEWNYDPEKYFNAFGKPDRIAVEREKGNKAILIAQKTYDGNSQMVGKSASEIMDILKKYEPAKGSEMRDDDKEVLKKLTINAQKIIYKQNTDPGGYAQEDKEIASLYKSANEAMATAQDASGIKVAQDLTDQAIKKSMAYQARAGIASYDQKVISKNQAAYYADQIQRVDPNNTQMFLQRLSQQYGSNYGGVVRAMQDLKPEEGGLDAKYELVALNLGQPFTNDLIEAIRQKPEALNSVLKDDKAKQDLVKALHVNPTCLNLVKSMSTTTAGRAAYYESLMQGTEAYAKVLLMKGLANNSNDAAKKAVQNLFGRVYDFGVSNGKTYAINKFDEQGAERTPATIAAIKNGLDKWLDIYSENTKLIAPDQFGGKTVGTSDAHNEELLKSNLKRHGFWATTPDNQGAELWIDPDGTGNATKVLGRNGKPIVKTFSEVR